ncbi:MAG: hypothetical protein K6C12_13845 [Oscillospiraceae bacterium]|nr:hypothetical protein [Oscillospiraceae bacterium]
MPGDRRSRAAGTERPAGTAQPHGRHEAAAQEAALPGEPQISDSASPASADGAVRAAGGAHEAKMPHIDADRNPKETEPVSEQVLSGETAVWTDAERKTLYEHFVPYIEGAHARNEQSLKAGLLLLVLLPVILVIIQTLTDSNRIAFLILWIIGMFAIAAVLIFTAYSDHDLKKTLEELETIVPPAENIELGNLLPVDAEGEGWLIDPQELPIPIRPVLSEKLPQMAEEIREKHQARKEAQEAGRKQRTEGKHEEIHKETAAGRHRTERPSSSGPQPAAEKKKTSGKRSEPEKRAMPTAGTGREEHEIRKMQTDDEFLRELSGNGSSRRKS